MSDNKPFDVLVVGAGPAGVGLGLVLQTLGVRDFAVLDRDRVGASFRRWPKEMRLITPSFTSNNFGVLDLNAIAPYTSPAFSFRTEHLSGAQYADYLQGVVDHFRLPTLTGVEVRALHPATHGWTLDTSRGLVDARCVVWAAGEFQYPRRPDFPGAALCRHTSTVKSWRKLAGDDWLVIGGYESGMDAAVNLALAGKRVRVLEKSDVWAQPGHDPSQVLSPFTWERVQLARATGRLKLHAGVTVTAVEKTARGYVVRGSGRQRWVTPQPPWLATGFDTSARLVADHFEWRADGLPLLTPDDESTRAPGLFLVGPSVRQDHVIFCFIYKFRQRFAVVARRVAHHLRLDPAPLEAYRQQGMFLDDLSCCGDACAC